MIVVDRERLLAFLDDGQRKTRSLLVQSVYQGLGDRIRRGDFDEEID
jgi:hypothetical protein